ncbi:MAG: glycosyltransferase family 9 protein [Candidatus Omnitrophica bacterium]|nr:glycosyltransferase family 9 protein [Candidatus Omnitrophota bacterium]
MRILITRTDRIGDVMLSTPVIKAVRDKYPDAYIAFCVGPHAFEIVDKNPYLNDVIVYDKKGKHKSVFGIIRFIFEIKRIKFDMAIILHSTNRMNLTCFLAGIPKRTGYDRKLGFLLTDKIPYTKQEGKKHEMEYTLDVIRHIGIEPSDKRLYMSLHKDTEKKIKKIFEAHDIHKMNKIVAINPGASCPSKRWPIEYFSEVVDRLNEEYGAKVIILGGPDSVESVRLLLGNIKTKVIDLTEKTSVSLLAGILSKSHLFISNDSGPVHIAVSVGTPVIAIFGRSDEGLSPKRWGPLGPSDIALHKDVGCRVCLAHRCDKDFKCLKAITVDEVMEAVEKFL